MVADRNKVVSAFNEENADGFDIGYSVSHNGGRTWVDMGNPPRSPDVQPFADPRLAIDPAGNIWLTVLAKDVSDVVKIALYEMPAGSDTFHLVSLPAVASAPGFQFQPDRGRLTIARDGDGRTHFYLTYHQYQGSPGAIQGPVVLADSTDATHWRHTTLTEPDLCEPSAPAAAPVTKGNKLYVFFHDIDKAACTHDPDADPTVTSGREEMVTVDVKTAGVLHRTVIAPIHGVGERVDADCGGQQVIATAPDLAARNASASDPTLGPDGVLYVVWPDRPGGLGGGFGNATRIYLSYSRDGGVSWAAPKVISGPLSATHMADRFQPALTSDAHGLHTIWYERVPDPAGGPDLIRTDKADLTLAGPQTGPVVRNREQPLSTVPWQFLPEAQTGCYAGDYIQVASNGVKVFATWGDLRNTVEAADGTVTHDSDVFSDSWLAKGREQEPR
ncbi:sialidase family protein [Streptomyces sp. NPDC059443]|uniref:sialidase family protein n=1 Tax=Streptomyces sp. NPDC059443 TaxID=3346831 RepID=UPI00367C43D6